MTWKCGGERAGALSFQIMRHIIMAGSPMYVNMYGYWWMYAYVCMFFGGGGSSVVVVAGCDL